jgi:hypothetical protein
LELRRKNVSLKHLLESFPLILLHNVRAWLWGRQHVGLLEYLQATKEFQDLSPFSSISLSLSE